MRELILTENNKVTSDIHENQVEKCDESGNGDNNAFCSNSSENFLDGISVSGNNNNINYDINTKQTNDCDDKLDGDNNVECENELKTHVNSLSLSGNNDPSDLDINTKQSNDCDDKTTDDNNLKCTNLQHRIEIPDCQNTTTKIADCYFFRSLNYAFNMATSQNLTE